MTEAKSAAPKLDLRKQYKEFYVPSAMEVVLVDLPEFLFVMLDGIIEAGVRPPDLESFRNAMAAMYGVGYGLKFMSKLADDNPIDFTVTRTRTHTPKVAGSNPAPATKKPWFDGCLTRASLCLLALLPDLLPTARPRILRLRIVTYASSRPRHG